MILEKNKLLFNDRPSIKPLFENKQSVQNIRA
jgi:hypothetical protein